MLEKLKDKFKKRKRHLHTNLIYLFEKYSLDIASLSIETGVPVATIFRMKKEDNNPTLSSLEPISEFFKIELNDLLYEDITSNEYQMKTTVGKVQYIPVVHLADVKAWPTVFNAKIYIGTNGSLSTNSFGIAFDTNSMSPVFYENTIVVVDPDVSEKDSDYVFCQLGADAMPVIRQLFIDGKSYFFKPINPNYGEMSCVKKFKIIGIIVKSIESYR